MKENLIIWCVIFILGASVKSCITEHECTKYGETRFYSINAYKCEVKEK